MSHAVILVGFMGAGKTTVGRLLSERLGWSFVDLDEVVREREGRDIAAIFRDSGEAWFRRLESECLRDLLERPGQGRSRLVLALGGGAFVQPANAALIRASGVPVVFLDAPAEELYRRCATQAALRPLFRDENQFRQLYDARRVGYMAAGVRVDTASLEPLQVAEEIIRRLDLVGR